MKRRPQRLRFLISAGPTREPLDPVRYVSNYSTGFMGACLAHEALRRGHHVTVVSGPTSYRPPHQARLISVETSHQMFTALRQQLVGADALIMAAAVCDFRPRRPARQKLARRRHLRLALEATPDLLARLPRRRGQLRVGFALETAHALTRATQKLSAKHVDLMVGQVANGTGGPFGRHAVEAFLITAAGATKRLGRVAKPALARAVLDEIEQLWYGGATRRSAQRRAAAHQHPQHRRV